MKTKNQTETMNQQGIWKRFFHTVRAANIPRGLLLFYLVLAIVEGQILIRIPEVNGNFFAGDVSAASVGMFFGFEILNVVVSQFILYVNHKLRYKMNRNLRNTLWDKILGLKPAYYDQVSPSSLISRITTDSDSFNTFVLDIIIELGFQIYYLVLTIGEMSKISIRIGFLLLAFVPLTVLLTFLFGRIQMKIESGIRTKLPDFTTYLSEILAVLPLLKSMNRQAYETKRGEAVIEEYYRANRKQVGITLLSEVVHSLAGIGPEIVIFLLGIRFLNAGTLDVGGWYMFYIYAGSFVAFANTLGSMWTQTKTVQGSLYKVSDVIYENGESLEEYVHEITASGDLQFDDVTFAYDEKPVVEHASFTLKKNRANILIGPSGAGKSTLLKLLERLYEPAQGRILMGTERIDSFPIRDWRSNVAYVSQSTPLFSGSIRENITYGIRKEVTDQQIMEVCRLTHLESYINSLEDGLEHEVGPFGEALSGGQRQKISVARALLSDAGILILDEPTASLDITSTHEICRMIAQVKETRTVIVITHDKEVVDQGDHVVVVNADHTIDEGSPKELTRISEFYRELQGKEREA